jgi:diphosphomevalonate decarboxylase
MIYRSAWRSPSNIALVKYWGKKPVGIQLPANASISFTLNNCYTETILEAKPSDTPAISLWLDDKEKPSFIPKIKTFIDRLGDDFAFLKNWDLQLHTHNSFPHSSGIASSASAMSALALCFYDLKQQINGRSLHLAESISEISNMARLGSGSACRSLFPQAAIWGAHDAVDSSSDLHAIPFQELHPVFQNFRDTILIVEEGSKQVSSTVGHDLLSGHPFAESRYLQAQNHLVQMMDALKTGDLETFRIITEAEAMSLHAMMMTSNPWFIPHEAEHPGYH